MPMAGSMNSNGTEQCRAFKQPLAGTVQKKLYKHKICLESPGPWKVWPELKKFISMDNLAQNTSYRICYMKELELCTTPVPPGLAKGDSARRDRGRQDLELHLLSSVM